MILRSVLQQKPHYNVLFPFCRSPERSPTLVIPRVNIRAVPEQQPYIVGPVLLPEPGLAGYHM